MPPGGMGRRAARLPGGAWTMRTMIPLAAISTWRTLGGAALGLAMFALLLALALALGRARPGGREP